MKVLKMNPKEFDRLEKVLSNILKEMQIHNKLVALQLTHELAQNMPLSLMENGGYIDLLKGIEETLKGYGLKEMTTV